MNIEELYRKLSFGELSNLAISNEGSGEIKDAKKPQILNYINDGLLRLYSRFVLKESDVIIEQTANITSYPLISKYAEMNLSSTEPHKFIKDGLDNKFMDDVIRITSVYDYAGYSYTLNDPEDGWSMFTPTPNTLQVPFPRNGVALGVGYQARHVLLTEDDLTKQIELPFYLEEALQNFVAHKAYNHMNGQDNVLKSQDFLAEYERICLNVEDKDLVSQTTSQTNTRFRKRGWV